MNEYFDVFDADGNYLGKRLRSECHGNPALIHRSVHIVVFDSSGKKILLQKRSACKDIQPGKWDTAVGGHVDYGEDVATALKREVREELGIEDCESRFLNTYLFESERERELIYVYSAVYDGAVAPSDELDGGRFWTLDEIKAAMGKELLTPNFEMEFLKVIEWMNL